MSHNIVVHKGYTYIVSDWVDNFDPADLRAEYRADIILDPQGRVIKHRYSDTLYKGELI